MAIDLWPSPWAIILLLLLQAPPPSAAAPLGLCVWLFYIINVYGYISYTFLIYSIYAYMFPRYYVLCIFPCVFLNLWSQEKTSPYRKTTFLLLVFQILLLQIQHGTIQDR